MSFLEGNFLALRTTHPDLLNQLKSIPEDELPKLQQGRSSLEVIVEGKSGFREDFEVEGETQIWPHARLVILFGFGLGKSLRSIMPRLIEMGGQVEVLIIEKDPKIFSLALQVCDLRQVLSNPKFHFWVGMTEEEIRSALMKFFMRTGRGSFVSAIQVISHPELTSRDARYFRGIERMSNEILHYASSLYGNSTDDSFRGFANVWKNLPHIFQNPGLKVLKNKFAGFPAIVVASGPSLDRELENLKGCEERALIIAADSALKPLLRAGIRPHIVTAIERDPIIPEFFNDVGAIDDMVLVACPVVVPAVFEIFTGPKVIAYRNFEYFQPFTDEEEMKPLGPTCGNMAYFVARRLGCSTLILVGQDLAYDSVDFRSHVRGTSFSERDLPHDPSELIKRGFFYTTGNQGEKVLTEPGLYLALLSYEKALLDQPHPCFNTSHGAAIRGTTFKKLSECLSEILHQKYPHLREKILALAKPRTTWESSRISDLEKTRDLYLEGLSEIHKKNDEAIHSLEHLAADRTSSELREVVIRSEAWCIELQDQHPVFKAVLKPVVTPSLVQWQIKLNTEILNLGQGDEFFEYCRIHYLNFLKEMNYWTLQAVTTLKSARF